MSTTAPHTPATPTSQEQEAVTLAKLTKQQEKFVHAWCSTFNGTRAALAAGYKASSARFQASRLLTKDNIKAAIKAINEKSAMDEAEIAARWTRLAQAGLDDFYTKQTVEVKTTVQQPLAEAIAETNAESLFEQEYASRAGLEGKELENHLGAQEGRRRRIIRWQMELERNPAATRPIAGPPATEERMVLDLVKAADLGLLDLVKAIVPTEFGTKVELRSPDAALENMAKYRGMLTKKIDVTSGGQPITPPAILGALSVETKREMLEARRKLKAQEGAGHA